MTPSIPEAEREPDRLAGFDFARHNEDAKRAWEAFDAGKPTRTPITLGANVRFVLLDPARNDGWPDFQSYSEDPDLMFETQLRFQRWCKFNLLQDAELGLPEKWTAYVDFENYYEAAWMGCPVYYPPGQVPDTRPAYADFPERVMENDLSDPFGGFMGKVLEYYERFVERAKETEYCGRPVGATPPWQGIGSDGLMTLACSVFGPEFVCLAMLDEPERLQKLLAFLTDAIIAKISAWRKRFGIPVPQDGFGIADDSIALISTDQLREHILPHLKRIYDAFGTPKGRSIHLCGDATRHFTTLRDELGISSFDTGFPVDFAWLRKEVGPEVRIWGGPHVELLRMATPQEVRDEVRRIMTSGILEGGMFVLREGNNLAPRTPLENIEAMYHAGREFGRTAE
jgi:uroporphyrinogen-III decarboxylase